MKTISGSFAYKGLYNELEAEFGVNEARRLWALAERINTHLYEKYSPEDKFRVGDFVFPAAAVFIALRKRQPEFDSMTMLRNYGTKTGEKIRKIIRFATSLPFAAEMVHKNLGRIMYSASGEDKGYTRKIISDSSDFAAVDILSCPLYDLTKKIGVPEVCQTVCAMDKVYMTGFRHIRYERTKSVAGGDDCCDYRLTWDKTY